MKYIITESRLEGAITEYLNQIFPLDDVNYTHPTEYDYENDENYDDDTIVEFFLGEDPVEDSIFRWYDCEYFDEGSEPKKHCPLVMIDHPYDDRLIGYFGDRWEEPFKKWFTENFDLPVKTVEWKRLRD